MQNFGTPLNTIEIKPENLKRGDQFQPMFNDHIYTCEADYDPNTMGVFIDGPDYCGHCTFFSDEPNGQVYVRLIQTETETETETQDMEHFTFFQSAIEFAAKRGGIDPAIYGSNDISRMLGQIHMDGYCAVAGQKITKQADRLFAVHAAKQQPIETEKKEEMTFEEEMQEIARLIGNKYRPTTAEWHVLNYIIEIDHGHGMGPDTKELRTELKLDGHSLGGILTSLQNKGLVDISDSTHMIGVSHDIVHPSDELKCWMCDTHGIAIGNY